MFDKKELEKIAKAKAEWDKKAAACEERDALFETVSGLPVAPLYTPADVADLDYERDLGFPGEYPYTRGVHPNMYRGRLWTMRQFAGFGTARSRPTSATSYLLEHGQTGLSVAFDFPTLMGYDSDHPMRAWARSGRCGVAIDSLRRHGDPVRRHPAGRGLDLDDDQRRRRAILLAFYLAVGEKQGVAFEKLRGTIQNDILKEYIAQKRWIFPPEPSLRIITDMMAFCAEQRAAVEHDLDLAATTSARPARPRPRSWPSRSPTASPTSRRRSRAGMDVDDFAPRLSFFFNTPPRLLRGDRQVPRRAAHLGARACASEFGAQEPALAGCCASTRRPPAAR